MQDRSSLKSVRSGCRRRNSPPVSAVNTDWQSTQDEYSSTAATACDCLNRGRTGAQQYGKQPHSTDHHDGPISNGRANRSVAAPFTNHRTKQRRRENPAVETREGVAKTKAGEQNKGCGWKSGDNNANQSGCQGNKPRQHQQNSSEQRQQSPQRRAPRRDSRGGSIVSGHSSLTASLFRPPCAFPTFERPPPGLNTGRMPN